MMEGISHNLARHQAVYECSYVQVSTFELCRRKWAWEWLDGVKPEKSKYALFGIGGHRLVESWLKYRTAPEGSPEARAAQQVIKHLPPPQSVDPANVELDAGIELGGVRFVMGIDLFVPSSTPPRVYDHKFTGSFDWALRPESLHDDVQATLYAAWVMVKMSVDRVDVQWTYGRRVKPAALPVRALLTVDEIRPRLERTVQSALEMKALIDAGPRALDVPYNPEACDAFGGCPFRDRCNLSPQDRMSALVAQATARNRKEKSMDDPKMSAAKNAYMEKLRANREGNGAAAAPGAVNPPPVASPAAPEAVAPPQQNPLAARLAAQRAAQAPAQPVVATPPAEAAPAQPAAEAPPAQPAADAAPARGRGRPAGSTSKPQPEDRWTAFASVAAQAMLGQMETVDHLDPVAQEGVAQAAASFADHALREYAQRFGG